MQKSNSNFQTKLNTSQNNFNISSTEVNKTMKVNFSEANNQYTKIGLNKISQEINPDIYIRPVKEDIYYDEIIFYDGGDVYGYGDD